MQATLEVLARLHEVLYVVDFREEVGHEVEEIALFLRQFLTGEDSHEVAKVIATGVIDTAREGGSEWQSIEREKGRAKEEGRSKKK